MRFRILILFFILLFLVPRELIAEKLKKPPKPQKQGSEASDQQINDFSITGYGEKGKRSWNLSGKTADIFTDIVKLKDVVGNLYGKDEDILLTAKRGDFNKADGKVHLEQDVVITTTGGTRVTTDSLDWDRRGQTIATKDWIKISRQNMVTTGTGALGQMDIKQVNLEKDVQVDILPEAKGDKPADPNDLTTITCDGPLEIDYAKNIATFNDHVKVVRTDATIYSDKMDVYFIPGENDSASPKKSEGMMMGTKIDKIIARDNVRIVRGENVSLSQEAIYSAREQKIVLSGGRPKVFIYSTEGIKNASAGN